MFIREIHERYEQLRHDIQRPLLPPQDLFLTVDQLFGAIRAFPQLRLQQEAAQSGVTIPVAPLPSLLVDHQAAQPLYRLVAWLRGGGIMPKERRILFTTETAGRREALTTLLGESSIHPKAYPSWEAFLNDNAPLGIVTALLTKVSI